MNPKVNARWFKATFQVLQRSVIQTLDVVEFDNKTYIYCDANLSNNEVIAQGLYTNAFQYFDLLRIAEVLRIAENVLGKLDFDIRIDVHGGGEKGQIEASRTALARSILAFSQSKELEKLFLEYDRNMLIADVRRKETYKPGDSKARGKRQTSYR